MKLPRPNGVVFLFRAARIALVGLAAIGGMVITAHATTGEPARVPADTAAAPSLGNVSNPNFSVLDSLLAQADSIAQSQRANNERARIFLSWDAPWGMPRASRTHWPKSGDPRAADTLWLCLLPGRTSVGFLGFMADLYFRAAPGDTLGPWWHMEHGAPNNGGVIAEFGPDDESFPQRQPWKSSGIPYAKMDRTPGSAHLQLLFAVPYTQAAPVIPDSIYTLCRVIFRHRRNLPGAGQPVCIEWGSSSLDYWLKDSVGCNRGERFVSYASDRDVCETFRPIEPKPPASSPNGKRKPATGRRRAAPAHSRP